MPLKKNRFFCNLLQSSQSEIVEESWKQLIIIYLYTQSHISSKLSPSILLQNFQRQFFIGGQFFEIFIIFFLRGYFRSVQKCQKCNYYSQIYVFKFLSPRKCRLGIIHHGLKKPTCASRSLSLHQNFRCAKGPKWQEFGYIPIFIFIFLHDHWLGFFHHFIKWQFYICRRGFELKCLDFCTKKYFISYAKSTQKCNCYSFLVDVQSHQVLKLSADKVSISNFAIIQKICKNGLFYGLYVPLSWNIAVRLHFFSFFPQRTSGLK